jgi:hypothetical protein
MNRQAMIAKVTDLIALCLAAHGYHVEKSGNAWQYRQAGQVTGGLGDKTEAVLAACESLLKGKFASGT